MSRTQATKRLEGLLFSGKYRLRPVDSYRRKSTLVGEEVTLPAYDFPDQAGYVAS